jgi:hypothetical protein
MSVAEALKTSESQYVKKRIRLYLRDCRKRGKAIDFKLLKSLKEQWKFDYDMQRTYGM